MSNRILNEFYRGILRPLRFNTIVQKYSKNFFYAPLKVSRKNVTMSAEVYILCFIEAEDKFCITKYGVRFCCRTSSDRLRRNKHWRKDWI